MARLTRPLIGINTDYIPPGKASGGQFRVHAGYCESIYQAGGMPMLLPPMLEDEDLEEVLEKLDGLLLTGCLSDMDPKRMGLNAHAAVDPMPGRREDVDRKLVKHVLKRRLPLLAVAVGMHELNVVAGGTLFMHLPEDMPKALPHKDPSGGPHRHAVLLEPHTRVSDLYGGGEIRVNSYHHQAVNEVAPNFRVAAKSPDGVIEAIEADDPDWFCVGVQWHPHSETASALDMQLFEGFLVGCGQREGVLQMAA
jgi:putative glutamine amidotransferase